MTGPHPETESPETRPISVAVILLKLKPDLIMARKNFGGVIRAVAVMWPSVCRTVHCAHIDGVSQPVWSSPSRSAASASRSA